MHIYTLSSFEALYMGACNAQHIGQVYRQMHLSTMLVDSSGALIGGAIGGSLSLSLVIVISSLLAVLILILV